MHSTIIMNIYICTHRILSQCHHFQVDNVKVWECFFVEKHYCLQYLLCELNMHFVCVKNQGTTIKLSYNSTQIMTNDNHFTSMPWLYSIPFPRKAWHGACVCRTTTGCQSANPLKRIDVETAQFSSVGSFPCSSPAQKGGCWKTVSEEIPDLYFENKILQWCFFFKSESLPNMKLITLKGSLPKRDHVYIWSRFGKPPPTPPNVMYPSWPPSPPPPCGCGLWVGNVALVLALPHNDRCGVIRGSQRRGTWMGQTKWSS